MELVKRFLKYVSFDTQSSEESQTTPSTYKQLELAKYLVNELENVGCKDVFLNDYGIVYATIPSNVEKNEPVIGLIAHLDTSPDCSGENVKPRIIKSYDGKDIVLNENIIMKVENYPSLKDNIGEDLIVTDGNTLLGADDKAGIAIIVEVAKTITDDKSFKHGDIKIAFTPDEEIGRGTENFDIEYFGCDFAYTIDGEDAHVIEYENFNAASATVEISGINVHPGSAKNKMINSILLAKEFDDLLPKDELPSVTEMYEGFHHLDEFEGTVEKTILKYIIRNHDDKILKRQMNDFVEAQKTINSRYNGDFVKVTLKEGYKNMKEIIMKYPEVLNRAIDAFKTLKIPYKFMPIRGGTDGAELSFKGVPCPNLGYGGYNFHGRCEYVSITQMILIKNILLQILKAK